MHNLEKLVDWKDIAGNYKQGLIVGNGGSIAVDPVFSK